MERKFDYDFSNNKIEYCFISETFKNIDFTLDEIIASTSESIVIYDTGDYVFNQFLKKVESILNDCKKIVIGLVNDIQLNDLKKNGVNGGFFRSTFEKCNAAIIIVDKRKYYVAFNENCIFSIKNEKSLNEIFEYINHLIWTKTSFEYCQGRLSTVKDSRLSVVKPVLKHKMQTGNHKYATKTLQGDSVLLEKEETLNKSALVLKKITKNAYSDGEELFVNLFDDYYYPIEEWDSLIKAHSLSNKTYGDLVGKQIWFNGKTTIIKKEDSLSKTIERPVDEYKTFIPDYELISKEYQGMCKTLHIHVDVKPMKVDKSYNLSESYSMNSNLIKDIESNLVKIEKLMEDKSTKKQIEAIRKEMFIPTRIELYNKFISTLEYGVDSLKNTKNKFKEIKYDLSWVVPSELLGKLYVKNKKNYLALKNEENVDNAKKWLKDNHLEAVLILE